MRLNCSKSISTVILLMGTIVLPVGAQNVRVEVGKRATAIPKVCEAVVPASIDGTVDVSALVKEANCKGAGDMISEYTYVMKSAKREKDKKGQIKEETTTYEVFAPTLKSGTRARGILLVTNRNGFPVPPDELEKERLRTGERLEKEENEIARRASTPPLQTNSERTTGMLPVGMYPHMRISRNLLGIRRGGLAIDMHIVLTASELTPLRREQLDGREMLVFNFIPRRDTQFDESNKYLAQLNGTIWIDAKDRIVARLLAWPSNVNDANNADSIQPSSIRPPAIEVEMRRLPEGVWLPRLVRLDGSRYPKLFDGVPYEINFSYSEYKRFNTEIKDVQVGTPKTPL
jgi:hypothetical protein